MQPITLSSDHKFSFSQQSLFDQCPYAYYLQYILRAPQVENAYSQYGTLAHLLLEKWARGEAKAQDLSAMWKEMYPQHVTKAYPPFPKGYKEKAYAAALDYFEHFDGFGDEWEILSAEEKFETNIGGYRFVGVSDLVLRHKTTGEIMVIDHKSKSRAALKKDEHALKRQLYVYARYVKERFGVFPTMLRFNLFRENDYVDEPFDINKYNEAMQWIEDSIVSIVLEFDWNTVSSSGFFCNYLCSCRNHCEAADLIIHKGAPYHKKKNE